MSALNEELPPAATHTHTTPWLGLGHGIFMALLLPFFLYQGWLGRLIRRRRLDGTPPSGKAIRRHRRLGLLLVILLVLGFGGGLFVGLLNHGQVGTMYIHFFLGLAIVLAANGAYATSRKIRVGENHWRRWHLRLGILVLCLYPVQTLLGLAMML